MRASFTGSNSDLNRYSINPDSMRLLLTPREANAIALYSQLRSNAAVGRAMGTSPKTACRTKNRGRRKLRHLAQVRKYRGNLLDLIIRRDPEPPPAPTPIAA